MNNSIVLNRKAQRAAIIRAWWNAKSESISAITGEEFTNGQVVIVHIILAMLAAASIAAVNFSFSLAFLLLACAAWAVYRLNMTEKGGSNE